MQNLDSGGPPTYRSIGEEDDLIPGTGVNMPQMNVSGKGNFNGKDAKFNKPNMDSKNMKMGGMGNLGGNIQGPNVKGNLNFEQNKESSQIFGIKTSGKKKKNLDMPNMNMPNMNVPSTNVSNMNMNMQNNMDMNMPPSALLDDDYDPNYGIEMGRINSEKQKSTRTGDLNYAGSLIGSVPDEKQKLIQIDSPQLRNPQSTSKPIPHPDQYSLDSSNVTRASIIKNKLNPRSMVP